MTTLLWVLAVAAMALGLLGAVLPLLPGTPLLFDGMLLPRGSTASRTWVRDCSRCWAQ